MIIKTGQPSETVYDLYTKDILPEMGNIAAPPYLPPDFVEHKRNAPIAEADVSVDPQKIGGIRAASDMLWQHSIREMRAKTSDGREEGSLRIDGRMDDEKIGKELHRGLYLGMRRMIALYRLGSENIEKGLSGEMFSGSKSLKSLAQEYTLYLDMNETRSIRSRYSSDILINPSRILGHLLELYLCMYIRKYFKGQVIFSSNELDMRGIDLIYFKEGEKNEVDNRLGIDVTMGKWVTEEKIVHQKEGQKEWNSRIVEIQIGGSGDINESVDDLLHASSNLDYEAGLVDVSWCELIADTLLACKDPERWPLPRRFQIHQVLKVTGFKFREDDGANENQE